ncbi:MAG: hypothetical protein AAF762_09875 [Pseudomonadota bacterium]
MIWGLAALFAVALYFGFSSDPTVDTGEGELVLTVPPEAEVSETEPVPQPEPEPAEEAVVEAEPAPIEAPASEEPGQDIQVPGDDATYVLLNAFRRDDGAIEITTQRTLADEISTTTRLIRCAPLEAGVIAEGDAPRNDDPEMERVVLGSAAAWLAAQACGAMR